MIGSLTYVFTHFCDPVNNTKQEDDADAEGMKPDEAAAAAAAVPVPAEEPAAEAPEADERKRASRRLLSSCQAVPGFLTEKFKMRDDVVVSHVEHRSNVLPHFQVRLPGDEKYEGKPRGCRNSSCGLITIADSNSFCNMSG